MCGVNRILRVIEAEDNKGTSVQFFVDDGDFEYLSQFEWRVSSGYAFSRNVPGFRAVSMHRLLMNCHDDKCVVDHKNWCRYDNQRGNLRVGRAWQNDLNKPLYSRWYRESGMRCVERDKNTGRWVTWITVLGLRIFLGSHPTAIEAGAVQWSYRQKLLELAWRESGQLVTLAKSQEIATL